MTLLDLRVQVNKITSKNWSHYPYYDPRLLPIEDRNNCIDDQLRILASNRDVKHMLKESTSRPDKLWEVIAIMPQLRGSTGSQTHLRNQQSYLQDNHVRQLETEDKDTRSKPDPKTLANHSRKMRSYGANGTRVSVHLICVLQHLCALTLSLRMLSKKWYNALKDTLNSETFQMRQKTIDIGTCVIYGVK